MVREQRSALVILCLGMLAVQLIISGMLMTRLLNGVFFEDWTSFYAAGTIVRTGQGSRLYDLALQSATQRALYGSVPLDAFPLPAFSAVVFAPLTALSFRESFLVWFGLNLGLLGLLGYAAACALHRLEARTRLAFVAAAVVSAPVMRLLFMGQVDLWVLAALVGCYWSLRSGQRYRAGALLAVGLFKPHLLVAALLLLLVMRQWKTLLAFAAAAVLLITLPALFLGPGVVRDELALVSAYPGSASAYGVGAGIMVNVRGMTTSLSGSNDVWLWLPLLIAASISSFAVAARVALQSSVTDAQPWALAFVLPLIYSPHVHVWSVVLVLPAFALYLDAVAEAGEAPEAEWILIGSIVTTALCFMTMLGLSFVCLGVMAAFYLFAFRWPGAWLESEHESSPKRDYARVLRASARG